MKELFAVAAALIAVAGNAPYVWQILKGVVRPHPYTWLVGTIVTGIVFFGQVAAGAGIGALPTAASGMFTAAIFLLSLKYGYKAITKSDIVFLALALGALVPWLMTKDPTLSVVLAVSIDLISFVPTVRKTWLRPRTEAPVLYGSNVLRHALALVSLQSYNITTALHSVVMIVVNIGMMFLIVVRRRGERGRNTLV